MDMYNILLMIIHAYFNIWIFIRQKKNIVTALRKSTTQLNPTQLITSGHKCDIRR